MKATFNTADFFNALQSVKPAMSLKSKAHANDAIKIENTENAILITAENRDTRIVSRVMAEVTEPFEQDIPPCEFKSIESASKLAKAAKAETSSIVLDSNVSFEGAATCDLTISHRLLQIETEPETMPETCLEVDRAAFLATLEKLAFCAGDDSQDSLSCVQLSYGDNKLLVSALDGHQCYTEALQGEHFAPLSPGNEATLPRPEQLFQWAKTIPKHEKVVRIAATETHFFAISEKSVYTSVFAPYRALDVSLFLAKRNNEDKSSVSFSRVKLLSALKSLVPATNANERAVYFYLSQDDCFMRTGNGKSHTTINCDFSGSVEKIAFPAKELLKIVESLDAETVTLEMTGAETPCFIGNGQGVFVLCPMKLPYEAEEETPIKQAA